MSSYLPTYGLLRPKYKEGGGGGLKLTIKRNIDGAATRA